VKGFAIGLVVACATALALLAAPSSAGAVVCPPPPPCDPSPYVVCALGSGSSATAIVPCGCPIALDAAGLIVPYGCVDLSVRVGVDRATASVGDLLRYSIEIRNAGPEAAPDVSLVDAPPPGLLIVSQSAPLGTLASGETASATVVARALQPGEVRNLVIVSTTVGDLDPSNNQATAVTDVRAASSVPKPPKPTQRYAKRSKHRRR
jgi:uncharacterized repeat protein (TIGR01451 family)